MNKKLPATKLVIRRQNRPSEGDFLINKPASLYLRDGTVFSGYAPAWQKGPSVGEVVFNTGMTGYIESLTDPSYHNQILVFTYPMIGNYGVQPDDTESGQIQVSGVVVGEAALKGSHTDSSSSLLEWLHSQDIPLLAGVDTRALTKHLRTKGTMLGAISNTPMATKSIRLKSQPLASEQLTTYNPKRRKKIILVDCGAKGNILRSLLKLPIQVTKVPFDYDYTKQEYDGVVISNGPGDPTDYEPTIAIARKALAKNKSVFGICLGSQIMGLAAGAKTYKLHFGHRGHNQPCIDTSNQRCYITSQNHGYAIDEKSLPSGWEVSFRNLNDNSVEGIRHTKKPFFSVQFHPEASPGPTDTAWLFDKFAKSI
ncbi:MAG TPA: glutamine-hydrolyzing carbamoyl-phosphate synthase small subunit [Patescibacteria group bacterium]|nr:glutamine-hydrolyzing carbamoyl-phosphate synthase small subunit [Patescibacteria group bacterium]